MKNLSIRALVALVAVAACAQTQRAAAPAAPPPQNARPQTTPQRTDPETNPDTPPAGRGAGRFGGGQGGDQQQAEQQPRPYARVVTAEAQTRAGLFKTHRIGPRLLFEIPPDQLGKDQLVVLEIAKTVLGSGYGGQAVGNRVLRWERRDNRVFLRSVSYEAQAAPNTPEYEAVQNANVNPILASFPIESVGPEGGLVIDVTRIFTAPLPELGPGTRIPGNIDANRTWIDKAVPFPDNVNVYSTLTFAQTNAGGGAGRGAPAPAPGRGGQAGPTNPSNTIVFSWSFHRLPDTPMMPRLCDDRVGYFSETFTDYTDNGDRVRERCYIARYRLEPKDPAAYARGEKVEPVKPIVYYIDPATPKKWIPYFKRAIESWQPAFEEAGFKNGIIAKEAPPNDPDWSPEDARYSVVRWLPSTTENASGPHVHDPRSGEILNAHIQFYQNVQNLQNSWYFTQAAAVDPRARKFPLPDSLMGRLLEYVLAHEVGHTLGFQHNMKASSAYPVDSLRSASFLKKWGHTPTLMDYSRFNYVAQPEDNIPVELLTPIIGPYDKWATKWGYSVIPNAKTPEAERATLDTWAREQDTKPWLRFSTSGSSGTDPGEETEAVGDADAVKATTLGLRNIKRSVQYLIPATVKPLEAYDDLGALYGRLIGQWRTELSHVANIIGGADSQEKYGSQQGVRFNPIARERQKEAVQFLNENAFATPSFFLVDDITRRMEPQGSVARLVQAQNSILNNLLQNGRMIRLSEYEHALGNNGYGMIELLRDVRGGVFTELRNAKDIDVYRRALQRAYVENLDNKLNPPPPNEAQQGGRGGGGGGRQGGPPQLDPKLSDLQAAVRNELKELDNEIVRALPGRNGMNKAHLEDLRHRIEEALKAKPAGAAATTVTTDNPALRRHR
jgi:hypothetical protein